MRPGILPVTVTAVVIAGIVAGAIYYQTKHDPLGVTEPQEQEAEATQAPEAETSPNAQAESPQPAEAEQATNTSPDLTVDANGLSKATAVMNTSKGVIRFKFYTNEAPMTSNRIVELINQKFYNGLIFHRVEPNFVIQTGDPQGTGYGGSGQNLKAEFNRRNHREGTVAMARKANDPDSADSQFYITLGPQPHLDQSYTVFGQVVEGMDVVRKIEKGDRINWIIIE